jgi:hypothetical protein
LVRLESSGCDGIRRTAMFEKEHAFFRANFKTLLEKYDGKALVINGDQLYGAYDTFGDAIDAADKVFKPGSVCIKHVDEYALQPKIML